MAYGSVVDYMNANKMNSGYNSRATLAKQYGIKNYVGSAQQNTQLLGYLQHHTSGHSSTTPAAPKRPTHISAADNKWYNQYSGSIVNGNANASQYHHYLDLQKQYHLHGSSIGGSALHNISIKALSGDKNAQAYLHSMHLTAQDSKHGLWKGVTDNQLNGNTALRTAYRHDNPYAKFTKNDEMSTYNRYNNSLWGNKQLTGDQLSYYNSIVNKWNLSDQRDPYNQQIHQNNVDKQTALNAQDTALNSSLHQMDTSNYQQYQQMNQDMENRGLTDSGIAADSMTQARADNSGVMSKAYSDAAAQKSDIRNQYDQQNNTIVKNQQDAQAQQAALNEKTQTDLLAAQSKQDQYLTSSTGYVYMNGKMITYGGKPLKSLDYQKLNETQRHNIATENNIKIKNSNDYVLGQDANQAKEDSLTAQMAHWQSQDRYNQDLLSFKGKQLDEQIRKDSENAKLGREKLYSAKDKQKYDYYSSQMKSADSHITSLQRKKTLTSADKAALRDWNNKRNAAVRGMGSLYGANVGKDDSSGGGGNYTTYAGYKAWTSNLSKANSNGVPKSANSALTWIASHESSFNPNAQNPKSTAHGYGQFLNSTRREYEKRLGLDYDNPVDQIQMMYQYTVDRYGSPAKAMAFWKAHNWY